MSVRCDDRRRVLVVEDEWLLADQLEDTLRDLGYAVVGPVPTVLRALTLIESHRPDAALLDVSLRNENSFPIADELAKRSIPFLFLTGYVTPDLPAAFAGCPLMRKPASVQALRAKLDALLHH